jgi:hypothetical protein
VFEAKQRVLAAQKYMHEHYAERAEHRAFRQVRHQRGRGALRGGLPARDPAGGEVPVKGEVAGVPTGAVIGLRRLGVATVYEASGRRGLVDAPLEREVPGSRAAGPARTVLAKRKRAGSRCP